MKTLADITAPFDSPLSRIWLIGPGDQCRSCPMADECPDRRECLHLEASAGLTTRLDGAFRRFPIGARQVGRVVAEQRPVVVNQDLAPLGLADPAWLSIHGIRSFGAFPLLAGGVCHGVLAIFSRRLLGADDARGLAATARLLAAALRPGPGAAAPPPRREPAGALRFAPRTLAEIEREAIERTLAETDDRVSGPRGAAKILGIKPTTLHSRMRRLGVRRAER